MDKSKLLDRVGAVGDDRLLLAKVLDRAEQANARNIPAATDFLSPQQQIVTLDLLRQAGIPETGYARLGGYEGAERNLFLFLPDWLDRSDAESQSPIRCLRAAFREEEKLTHRDFLGSLMGMGIVREKVGDILVGPGSADLLVLDTVADFLLQSWDSAGRAKLTVTEIDPAHIHIPQVQCQEVRDTVSSLRLDNVLASGFGLSRGKAAEAVEKGAVQVNYTVCQKPDKPVSAGDVITCRGLGKCVLDTVGSPTKKNRLPVVIRRFI